MKKLLFLLLLVGFYQSAGAQGAKAIQLKVSIEMVSLDFDKAKQESTAQVKLRPEKNAEQAMVMLRRPGEIPAAWRGQMGKGIIMIGEGSAGCKLRITEMAGRRLRPSRQLDLFKLGDPPAWVKPCPSH
jgi:hypothetical protein